MIKSELRRAFFSKNMVITMILCFVFLVGGGWDYVIGYINGYINAGTYIEKFLMSLCHGVSCWLVILFPLVAAVPYAMSYRKDRDCGYRQLLILKDSVWRYRMGKLVAVICSGFWAFVIPCFAWLLVCCFVFGTGDTTYPIISGLDFCLQLLEKQPFLYGLIYVGNAGLQGAVFALLILGLSAVVPNKYLAALIPFCYCFFSAAVLNEFSRSLHALTLFALDAYTNYAIGYWGILVYDAVLACLGTGLFLLGDAGRV